MSIGRPWQILLIMPGGGINRLINSRRRCRTGGASGGFTLLELLAVLALLALLMGLVLPGLLRSWEKAGVRANLRQFSLALRLARSEAVTRGNRVRLFLSLPDSSYSVENTSTRGDLRGLKLEGVRLVWQDQEKNVGYVAFYGDGSSSGGRIILVEPTGQRHLVQVQPITGRVDLDREEK